MMVSLSSRGLACLLCGVPLSSVEVLQQETFHSKCVFDLCVGAASGVVLNPSFMPALRLGDLHVCGHQLKRGNVVERFPGSER